MRRLETWLSEEAQVEAQVEVEIQVGAQAIVGADQVQLNELTKSEEDGKLQVRMGNGHSDLAK